LIVPSISLSLIFGLSLVWINTEHDTPSTEVIDFANLLLSAIALLSLFGVVGLLVSARWRQVKQPNSTDMEGKIELQD